MALQVWTVQLCWSYIIMQHHFSLPVNCQHYFCAIHHFKNSGLSSVQMTKYLINMKYLKCIYYYHKFRLDKIKLQSNPKT